MKLRIKNFILVTILAFVTIGGTTSCSSKKKLAKKEYEAKVAQAKADLNAIIAQFCVLCTMALRMFFIRLHTQW